MDKGNMPEVVWHLVDEKHGSLAVILGLFNIKLAHFSQFIRHYLV
jgi:hypothetical protein